MYGMKLPSQGGPPWTEYTSEHFRLVTDLYPEDARDTLKELEERRTGLLNAAWHGADFKTRRTRVVMFRNSNELQEFMFRSILGLWTVDATGDKVMIMSREGQDAPGYFALEDVKGTTKGMRVLTHELTHDLGSSYFAHQPRWLSEGMARFLETLQVDDKQGKVIIGTPDMYGVTEVRSLPKLFEYEERGYGPDYEEAASLVFYLANHEGKAFNEYQRALSRGDEGGKAWASAFPAYATTDGLYALTHKVNDAVKELHYTRKFKTASAALVRYEGAIDERSIREPEIRALRAELFLTAPNIGNEETIRGKAAEEVKAALAQDPGEVLARVVQIELLDDLQAKLEVAKAGQAARPQDFRAWLLVDQALENTKEEMPLHVRTLETAVALAPDSPWALQRLARVYANSGRAGPAVGLARKSLSMFPDSAQGLDTYALVMFANADCKAAVELQSLAIERLPHVPKEVDLTRTKSGRHFLQAREEMHARLGEYRKSCR